MTSGRRPSRQVRRQLQRPLRLLERLEDRRLLALAPELITDINTVEAGSNPVGLTEMEGAAYFSANTEDGGQLWRTEGTAESTRLVADIPAGSQAFAVVEKRLFFVGAAPDSGRELWVTDGTTEGTRLVKDIKPGWQSASISSLTASGQLVFFDLNDVEAGRELWRSDGTAEGTFRVLDIRPGSDGSYPEELFDYRGQLAFVADDGVHGREIWLSDGTAAGTRMLVDLFPGSNPSWPAATAATTATHTFAALQDNLYFVARDDQWPAIWRYDGAQVSRILLADKAELFATSNAVFAVVGTRSTGIQLLRLDGESPVPLLDFPADTTRRLSDFTAVAGGAYFIAERSPGPQELWRTDGSVEGTALVATLGEFGNLFASTERLFYFESVSTGVKLWSKAPGDNDFVFLRELDRVPDNTASGLPRNGLTLGNRLLFAAEVGEVGAELWTSDGSATGTQMLANLALDNESSAVIGPELRVGNYVFFNANDGRSHALWRTDGTGEGTIKLTGLPGDSSGAAERFIEVNGVLFFVRTNGPNQLWRSDGTLAGTYRVHQFDLGFWAQDSAQLTAVGNTLFFFDRDSVNGMELWKSDGTEAGTALVKDVRPGPDSGSLLRPMAAGADGVVYFIANDGVTGIELWRSDGTAEGTRLVVELAAGSKGSDLSQLTWWNGQVYFVAQSAHRTELWSSDGSAAGTSLLRELRTDEFSGNPRLLKSAGGYLYFTFEDSEFGPGLWRTDGTAAGTIFLRNLDVDGPYSDSNGEMVALGDVFYFVANDGITGNELWRSDGTAEGTKLVADISPGLATPLLLGLTAANDALFFLADGSGGRTVWRSDGTSEGTRSLGIAGFHDQLSVLGRSLIVSTRTGPEGSEPHSITPPLGDTNYDGLVDLSDFGRLKADFGAQGSSLAADFDLNGVIDLSDFGLLKDNFGRADQRQVSDSVMENRAAINSASPYFNAEQAASFLEREGVVGLTDPWLEAVAYQLAWTRAADQRDETE